jgi:hypothetical protein
MLKTRTPSPKPPEPHYYQPTDRIGSGLYLWLPLVGGIGAILLGGAYAFLASVFHEVEAPICLTFTTVAFAAALVPLARWVCHLGNVRRPRARLPVALCVAAIAFYASWHIYLNFYSKTGIFDPVPSWAMSPLRLCRAMVDLAHDRGASSWFLWLLEAATIFSAVLLFVGKPKPGTPFCEKCGHWTHQVLELYLGDKPPWGAVEEFKQGRVDGLDNLGPWKSYLHEYLIIRVLECSCHASRFASIDQVTKVAGRKRGFRLYSTRPGRHSLIYDFGGETTEVTPLITNMEIDAEMLRQLEDIRDGLKAGT